MALNPLHPDDKTTFDPARLTPLLLIPRPPYDCLTSEISPGKFPYRFVLLRYILLLDKVMFEAACIWNLLPLEIDTLLDATTAVSNADDNMRLCERFMYELEFATYIALDEVMLMLEFDKFIKDVPCVRLSVLELMRMPVPVTPLLRSKSLLELRAKLHALTPTIPQSFVKQNLDEFALLKKMLRVANRIALLGESTM